MRLKKLHACARFFNAHLGPSISELYSSCTHPLRFNVRIHSIRTTNAWHCSLLSTISQFTKLSILKLAGFRCLPAIQRKTGCNWTKQTIVSLLLTTVHQKLINFWKDASVQKGGDSLESLIGFFPFFSVGGFMYANKQSPLSWFDIN